MSLVMGLQWFGEHWGAPVCDWSARQPTPVGSTCVLCCVPIEEGAQGLLVPHIAQVTERKPWHLDCFLRSVGVSPKAGEP